ncbi:MAG: T9SS type A sorting domain-containing protein [Bacteroidota bacterium]
MKQSLLFAVIMFISVQASAQVEWPHNEFEEGLVVGGILPSNFGQLSYVSYSKIIPSDLGSYWIVYSAAYEPGIGFIRDTLYFQKVYSNGAKMFNDYSVMPRVGVEGINGGRFNAVSDGAGGVLFCYANGGIRLQRINSGGTMMYGSSGKTVTTNSTSLSNITESRGNFFVTWREFSGSDYPVKVQRINLVGDILWQDGGISVQTKKFPSAVMKIKTSEDGNGGLAVLYERSDSLFWQLINPSGERRLATESAVSLYADKFSNHTLTDIVYSSDQWYFAFDDTRYGSASGSDIFLFKINVTPFGQIMMPWISDTGKVVCLYPGNQSKPAIVRDDQGGVIVTWIDQRNSLQQGKTQVYSQRYSSGDAPMWIINGTQVSANYNSNSIYFLPPVMQNSGFVFPLVEESQGIYAQKLNNQGTSQWFNPVGRIHSIKNISLLDCVVGPGGNIFIAYINLLDKTFRIKMLDRNGYLGFNGPGMMGVKDVINDQGGKVSVLFNASWREINPPPSQYSSGMYRLYRGLTPTMVPEGKKVLIGSIETAGQDGTLIDLDQRTSAGVPIYWEQVAEIAPQNVDRYSKVTPTISDSGKQGTARNYFMAAYGNFTSIPPVVWYSNIDSGYSVDNLPPYPPQIPAGAFSGGSVRLHWKKNLEEDLAGYEIYRGTTPSFIPAEQNMIAAVGDTLYQDGSVQSNTNYYYIVKAVDIHGNKSSNSSLVSLSVLSVTGNTNALPTEYALDQNFPNPFNPSTTIAYAVPVSGHVTMRIFDALGRLVETPVDRDHQVGRYSVQFSGTNRASGFYLCEIRAEGFVRRIKMNLVK